MPKRAPQVTDDVVLALNLPSTTEEWAVNLLKNDYTVIQFASGRIRVETTIGGNTNALSCAKMFLEEVDELLKEGNVDPMGFSLFAHPRLPPDSKG